MKGKIVLFGGRYDPGDEHLTPAGLSFGVDIIAAIIGTELDGGGRPPVNSVALFALAFASAVVLWLLMSRLASKPLTVLVVLGGAIVWVFASLCSFLLTGSYRLRGSFIVILLFVLGNRIWNDFQHKREEKAALPGPAAPQA